MMKIEIDPNAGFCFGVVNAIQKAEELLKQDESLYCIGDIVHNSTEVERLTKLGLHTINHQEFASLSKKKVLFRAHGEPPLSYETAKKNQIEIVDASCPVVLNLQKRIRKAYQGIQKQNGQIVIYGKKGHAEVNGLVGQTNGNAIVVENTNDLKRIDCNQPVVLFSQTTKTIAGFKEIAEELQRTSKSSLEINDTICRKVSNRVPLLTKFARQHEVIIFVSGKKSSNGKLLFDVCRQTNPKSYFVSDSDELDKKWFESATSVGISGATSTPKWLMKKIQDKIKLQIKSEK